MSKGLASVVEYAFQKSGRPNGYILGSDAGGAFVAGLRYGEGTLYTRDAGAHRVFWQGPSIGYDFGGEGSKTMVLVYNLRDPSQIYERLCGRTGLRLPCRRRRYPVPDAWQRDPGAHPVGDRPATRCERRIFEVYPLSNVESILSSPCGFRISPVRTSAGMKALRTQLASRIIRSRRPGPLTCEVRALREVAQSRTQA